MKSIDQLLYDVIFIKCLEVSINTFDLLPPLESPYPFIIVGEVTNQIRPTKTAYIGKLNITIDVWAKSRIEASTMIDDIFKKIKRLNNQATFTLDVNAYQSRLLRDTSTGQPLWHGIINAYYNAY